MFFTQLQNKKIKYQLHGQIIFLTFAVYIGFLDCHRLRREILRKRPHLPPVWRRGLLAVTMETEALQQRPISEHFSNLLPLRLFPSFFSERGISFPPSRLVINPGSMISVLVAQLWGLVLSSVQENVPETRHRHRVWASTATNRNREPKTPHAVIHDLATRDAIRPVTAQDFSFE